MLFVATFVTFTTFAQKNKINPKTVQSTSSKQAKYFCEMHPEVVSSKPGKCPKCNMNLSLSKKEQMKMDVMKIYTCSMHPGVESKKPGKCPKCNMDLAEVKTKTK